VVGTILRMVARISPKGRIVDAAVSFVLKLCIVVETKKKYYFKWITLILMKKVPNYSVI